MPDKNKKNDVFLQSIGNVKPLKKSYKKFKEISILKNPKIKKEKISIIEVTDSTTIGTKNAELQNDQEIKLPSFEKKIKKGKIKVDKKVDFHGFSVDQAKKIFIETIDSCFYSNNRCILFVTGKGMKKNNPNADDIKLFHGKIRQSFQSWVFETEVAPKILRVTPAGFSQGGDGAFFVFLRKNRY